MKFRLQVLAGATAALLASFQVLAAVSAEEAKQLGDTLTEFGAIKAGNAEGTIPPYSGGVTEFPAGFKPGSGKWVDPYAADKPLFRIDAKNMAQYADKLSAGQKNLLAKNPGYYINVYPTRRSATYPDHLLKATVRNATACKTEKDNLAISQACRGGIPFPIPKNGYEVMWNQQLIYRGEGWVVGNATRNWLIDSSGSPVMTAEISTRSERPYYQTKVSDRDPLMYQRTFVLTEAPARKAGEGTLVADFIDTVEKPRRAWLYTPGQRRIKLAPEFSYDTPVATAGGVLLYDEIFLFSGKMDRFDFKLVGKKEMFIPYNNFKLMFNCPSPTEKLRATHLNPECERWELHRVWVVEATLKPGMRHAYAKRVYYFDEDNFGASGMFDAYDVSGELYRSAFNYSVPLYDLKFTFGPTFVIYDFNKRMYSLQADYTKPIEYNHQVLPDLQWTAEAIMAREGAR